MEFTEPRSLRDVYHRNHDNICKLQIVKDIHHNVHWKVAYFCLHLCNSSQTLIPMFSRLQNEDFFNYFLCSDYFVPRASAVDRFEGEVTTSQTS